jgi:hypothetical protein
LGHLSQCAVVSVSRFILENRYFKILLKRKLSFGPHFRIHRIQFHSAELGLKFLHFSSCQSGESRSLHEFLFFLYFLIDQLDSHNLSCFLVSFFELNVEGMEFDFGLLLTGEYFFHDENFVF